MRNIIFVICSVFFLVSCNDDNAAAVQNDLQNVKTVNKADVSFLHISDTHGSSISISPMISILNSSDCDFGIITGDVLLNSSMMSYIHNSEKPIFLVPGNHDAYDVPNGQISFRNNLEYLHKKKIVQYGNDESNYYYADILRNGKTTRVIGLDQYEIDKVGRAGTYDVVMSQSQIDWFIDLLTHSYDVNGLVVLIHNGMGNSAIGRRNVDNRNSFISTLSYNYASYLWYGSGNPLMIPEIINAYITGVNIKDKHYSSGYEGETITITTSFEGEHHNFVGYFGGHVHWDLCEYLPDYPKQLQILMCFSGFGTGKYMDVDYNDIIKSNSGEDSYNINLNVIDYQMKSLNIYRLGARKLCTGGTRDSINFQIFK
jgi:hypothetical protein